MADIVTVKAPLVAAASQGGTPVWVTPLIAAAAAIAAAIVTAFASAYAARRKVAELELSHSFELAKQYLESARNYTQAVYLPLAVAVYKLHKEFLTFKTVEDDKENSVTNPFVTACETFISTVDDLFLRGGAAVLTLRLDETLTLFSSFLRESLTAERVIRANLLETAVRAAVSAASIALAVASPTASVLVDFALQSRRSRSKFSVAAAPITSGEFEEQFAFYISTIKSSIKEVTLGKYKEEYLRVPVYLPQSRLSRKSLAVVPALTNGHV
jgi:hypothetical protein